MTKTLFLDQNGVVSQKCVNYYENIRNYAIRYDLKNTLITLDLAAELHNGKFRDGGLPYVVHPLEMANLLILLNIRHTIFDMNLHVLHNKKLAKNQTKLDLDILLAACLLHDVIEDCKEKLPNKGNEFITDYDLHSDILKYVTILTKDKEAPGYTLAGYFDGVCKYWQTLIIKLVDRANNCSTINAYSDYRMEKYVKETKEYFYIMASTLKNSYPEFSRQATVLKYLFVSICETVASALNIKDIISEELYDKTFYFIKGVAAKNSNRDKAMPNTLRALPLAKKYYAGITRKSGDAFIIHPLRVCSYLISLKINDDEIAAAALLHEIIKKCHLYYNGIEIVTKHHLDFSVLELIRLVSNSEDYPIDLYYEALMQNPKAILLKLSNKAHTCTMLINSSDDEIREYVAEYENYIYPLCDYAIKHYPQYAYAIQIMHYHISSICNIVKSLKL